MEDLWRAAIDSLRNDTIERRGHAAFPRLANTIATLLEDQGSRPGLLASLLTDNEAGSADRIAYVAETFRTLLVEPTEGFHDFEQAGRTRPFNYNAFFALMSVGIGSIAAAGNAVEAIYGFDVSNEHGRKDLANDLADILHLGILVR